MTTLSSNITPFLLSSILLPVFLTNFISLKIKFTPRTITRHYTCYVPKHERISGNTWFKSIFIAKIVSPQPAWTQLEPGASSFIYVEQK